MRELARAKLNLALHVLGRRGDGYHELDTIFAFVEHGDLLEAEPAAALTLRIAGPFAPALTGAANNLVLRAAQALHDRFGVAQGAALTLEKRVPVAAGLGGGSADAAAALRLLARLWGLDSGDPAFADIASALGADVPACLLSRPARGRGRGDALEPLDLGLAGTPVLLVNPGTALSTAAVFGAWRPPGSGPLPANPVDGGNDLETPAVALAPEIGIVLERLRDCPGVGRVAMSGSGATCFALFESAEACGSAAAAIGAEHPPWWTLPTRLI